MATGIGPDGRPAVFEGGGRVSQDRRFRWNGAVWLPVKSQLVGYWLQRVGVSIVFLALVGYVIFTLATTATVYSTGFYVGVVAFFAMVFVIFRSVGRWGVLGIAIRAASIGLALLKVLTLIARSQHG